MEDRDLVVRFDTDHACQLLISVPTEQRQVIELAYCKEG